MNEIKNGGSILFFYIGTYIIFKTSTNQKVMRLYSGTTHTVLVCIYLFDMDFMNTFFPHLKPLNQ